MSGMIAGKQWQQPLEEGAHLMTMSTYKSLGGPPAGLILTNEPELAQRLDAIAFPGLTANFDAGKTAALAITLLDWKRFGTAYAQEMKASAIALAEALAEHQVPLFSTREGVTTSHQFAVDAVPYEGGQKLARRLRRANILTCGIGVPGAQVQGDTNALRLGTPEIVRWGMSARDMPELAGLIARVLSGGEDPEDVAGDVTALRQRFTDLHFIR